MHRLAHGLYTGHGSQTSTRKPVALSLSRDPRTEPQSSRTPWVSPLRIKSCGQNVDSLIRGSIYIVSQQQATACQDTPSFGLACVLIIDSKMSS